MSGVVAFEGELNAIVKEYLECNEFDRTLPIFEKECTDKGKPVAPSDSRPRGNPKLANAQNELLRMFKDGEGSDFFKLWEQVLPQKIRNEDTVAQKLEFYLNIYFAIYPIKHNRGDAEEGMNRFKTYLENRGATLSQTTEFLPFYALPFVPNPKMHPSYRELFADKWVPDLKVRLEKFLTLALQAQPQPRLFELYKGGGGERQIRAYEQRLMEAERKASTYGKRCGRVQNDYQNLIGITADLVDSLERTVQGDPVTPEYLQQICTRLFSNQIRQSVDITRPGTAGELLRQSVVPPQGLQRGEAQQGQVLDYAKIKADLTTAPDRTRAFLLQALRWKLTKSAPPERDTMLQAFIQHDILGCISSGAYRRKFLELLESETEVVRQYAARLLNAFASLCDGRSYLAQNADLMRALMDNLRAEDKDSLTRENVLGCLQKLSLRRQLQTIMIDEGVISWLVSVLEDNDALSDYTLEYSVALLMNLCLRSAGKKKCTEHSNEILKVLSDLMGHENQEIIPYVNGTLYSILAIPAIREDAKAMGMEDILKCFIKEGEADMNRQIEFIIKQLNSTEEPDEAESDDEEDDEDEEDADAMEADLDKQEAIRQGQGELSGDRLLNTYYVAAGNVSARRRKQMEVLNQQEDMLRRPVTPAQRKFDNPVLQVQPKTSRPPTGSNERPDTRQSQRSRAGGSRPSSRDQMQRPHTSSGRKSSRPNTQDGANRPMPIMENPSQARAMRPSQKAVEKLGDKGKDLDEYTQAFNTRPKIPRSGHGSLDQHWFSTDDAASWWSAVLRFPDRTPAEGTRPTSRGSIGRDPPPRPEYSESLPTSRPGSGGRPSSNGGNKTPGTPSTRTKPSSRGKVK